MTNLCPFLEKYYIPLEGKLEDWMKWVCEKCCPLQDLCIFDIEGKVPSILIEKLKNAVLPCPKCQKDAVYVKEVKDGVRISGLGKNEDGWQCLYCGYQIYKSPIFYKKQTVKRPYRKRSRKMV